MFAFPLLLFVILDFKGFDFASILDFSSLPTFWEAGKRSELDIVLDGIYLTDTMLKMYLSWQWLDSKNQSRGSIWVVESWICHFLAMCLWVRCSFPLRLGLLMDMRATNARLEQVLWDACQPCFEQQCLVHSVVQNWLLLSSPQPLLPPSHSFRFISPLCSSLFCCLFQIGRKCL